jgi:hypothetical protein
MAVSAWIVIPIRHRTERDLATAIRASENIPSLPSIDAYCLCRFDSCSCSIVLILSSLNR